jgi:hypothetical protein
MRTFLVIHRALDNKSQYTSTIDVDTIDAATEQFPGLDWPISLHAIDTEADMCRPVNDRASSLLAGWICSGRITETDAIRNYIERYSWPGELIPAAT